MRPGEAESWEKLNNIVVRVQGTTRVGTKDKQSYRRHDTSLFSIGWQSNHIILLRCHDGQGQKKTRPSFD